MSISKAKVFQAEKSSVKVLKLGISLMYMRRQRGECSYWRSVGLSKLWERLEAGNILIRSYRLLHRL